MDSIDLGKKNLYDTIADLRYTVSHMEVQLENSRKEIETLTASNRRLKSSGYMGYNPAVETLKREIQTLNASLDKKKKELEKSERVIKEKDFEIDELKHAHSRLISEVQEVHDRKLKKQDIKIDEQDIRIREQSLQFTINIEENKAFQEQIRARMDNMLDNDQRNEIKQNNAITEYKSMTTLHSGSSSDNFNEPSHVYSENEAMSRSDGMNKKTLNLNVPSSTSSAFKSEKKKKNEKANEERKSKNRDGPRLSGEFLYPTTPSRDFRAPCGPLPPISGRAPPRKHPPKIESDED